jgi:hypothetical protein
VTLSMRYLPGRLELEIAGELGVGETLAAARERVSVHGGRLAVDTLDTGRTVLRADLPLGLAHA